MKILKATQKISNAIWIASLVSICYINANSVFAQSCLPGGISFTSQAQIDAFPTDYPGCTEIQGSVTINDALFGNITNLDGLVQITSISGSLVIVNNGALSSITGLSSLSSISYDLIIDHNNALTNLAGLNLIPAINSTLQISNNNLLSTLSDLSAIATIGTLIINNNNSLINLSGLDNVFSINGSLNISNNNNLITLNGLNSLVTVGSLTIDYNNSLTNISALNSIISLSTLSVYNNNLLTNITGIGTFSTLNTLSIHNNNVLSDISGLTTLTSITGPLYISENSSLINLTGLNGLTYVNGDLSIQYNYSLNNISALSGINFIDGQLIIKSNNLTSLAGLENINPASITTLYLENSNTLSTCNVQSICEFLSFPNNPASISGNACGCESRTQIETACSGSGCPIGDITLNYQSEIDAFALNYPTCVMITGNLTISESFNGNITNLNGLSQITSITGSLIISGNSAINSLMGLDALSSVGGSFSISSNNALTSLNGLEDLSSIGENLNINSNNTLSSLTSLNSLLSIGGILEISSNATLTNLSGLDNIDPTSINYLYLNNSSNLSICDIPSICEYLAIPSNQAQIDNNASGCYNREDIQSNCIGCPLGDVYLSSQAQIDAFILDYPTCTTILGSLTISDNYSGSITNLNGLDNITAINGQLRIQENSALSDVEGLDAVTSIMGQLTISFNSMLANISGLTSLNTLGSSLQIQSNPALSTITGLNSLNSVGAGISIAGNPTLTNLSNFLSINTINGNLYIGNNNALTSLSGLDNIAYSSITGLEVYYSNELSICDVPSICDFINLSSNYRNIVGNALGCNSESEVSISCSGCPVGDVTFSTQTEIDLFPATYPTCTQIYGNLYIDDNGSGDITDLSPLTQITSVSGSLYITDNSALTQLSGLNSLTSIGGSFYLSNNAALTDLSSMTTLTTINGDLNVTNNTALTTLTGLNNINPSGITNLTLQSSTMLATCDVTSICNYLATPSNPASISDNALGCNSRPNVENVCLGCPSGDVSLSTQLEVDNFPINYPGCSHIFGNLTIDDGGSENITSLSTLSQITTVDGDFNIQNTNALQTLNGLSGLGFIGGNVNIIDNSSLEDLLGLNNLGGIGSDLTISSNGSLINLTGLTILNWIDGSLTINDNNSLANLEGMSNLVSIFGSITVSNNPALTNLANLSQVSYFQGFLAIQNNPGLTSLSGLDNIPYQNITSLTIENSSLLSICQLQNICNYLTYTSNPTSIFGNAPGCLTRGQVQAYCTDQDNDNTIDSLDNCATIYNPLQEDADTDMVGDACDFGTQHNVGIGTELPVTKLQVSQGVMFTDNNNGSLLMRSPDNSCWILKVGNYGELSAKKVPCPN